MPATPKESPFVCDWIESHVERGVLLCDPARLNGLLKGASRGRDLTRLFIGGGEVDVYGKGIAVALFDHGFSACRVAVRDSRGESTVGGRPRVISTGWILGTNTGRLQLCSFDSLLFWEPYGEELEPKHYIWFKVPPGWYKVTIRAGRPLNERWQSFEENDSECGIEFVLTQQKIRPKFRPRVYGSPIAARQIIASSDPTKTEPVSGPPLDPDLLKAVLSRLTPEAFEAFVTEFFGQESGETFNRIEEAGGGAFRQPLPNSYGDSLHSVFLLHYLPLGAFTRPRYDRLSEDPGLMTKLQRIKERYAGAAGYFGMVSPALIKAT